jgi:hypothetical protein
MALLYPCRSGCDTVDADRMEQDSGRGWGLMSKKGLNLKRLIIDLVLEIAQKFVYYITM